MSDGYDLIGTGELARRLNVSPSMIRYLEERNVIPKALRLEGRGKNSLRVWQTAHVEEMKASYGEWQKTHPKPGMAD